MDEITTIPSKLEFLIQLLNVTSGIIVIYCLFSMPTQLIRRFRRKWNGKAVSPISLIFKKILKGWLLALLILVPISSLLTYSVLNETGAEPGHIFAVIVTQSIIGNILTSFFYGYVFIKINKSKWSYSAKEEKSDGTVVEPTLDDLVSALKKHINEYVNVNGVQPKSIMIDYNIHTMFFEHGIYKINGFDSIKFIPSANISDSINQGLSWKVIN
ncbi:hypothetical protein [Shewanella algae]|uniref:hypothetical protein n=1 Tax=Shewanella algae TaxID=38313 RepID=UPI001AAD5870|nr:hypothetical protein [Shewanella algae]MBO2682800.1 hypothetical protein [Shewanella algae]